MDIINLTDLNEDLIRQVAALLTEGFRLMAPTAWPNLDAAIEEVRESLGADRLSRVAVDKGIARGWIGGIRRYAGHTWEIHPLVVSPDTQRRGIGRALVADFEEQVADRGAETVILGTDDEEGMTSLAGVDLYPSLWQHVRQIRNLRQHPYEFYQKLGYIIVGVIPDANGPGKPDILMAKRVGKKPLHQ